MLGHVHDALRQVALMRSQLRDSTRFRGYSGTARVAGGFVALAGAFLISGVIPANPVWHVAAWCVIGAISFLINSCSLLYYRRRSGADLKHQAVTDPFAVLLVSGVLTVAIIRYGAYPLLYGTWMTFFGLMHLGARKSLSTGCSWLGGYYIVAGAVMLIFRASPEDFLNPWPMAIVFFLGEITGGILFARLKVEES